MDAIAELKETKVKEVLVITEENLEIQRKYGLDFHIAKVPSVVIYEGEVIESDYFGLLNCKTKEIINQVKGTYHVSQNEVVIALALKGMSPFRNMEVVKAGELNGGRKVFLQLSIEGDSYVGNDTIKRYVTILDSNDGTASLSVGIGDKTMSCSNQFFKFYKAGESKFRHSMNMEDRIREIPQLIEFALLKSMKMTEIYGDFQKTSVTNDLINGMINHLLDTEKLDKDGNKKEIKGIALTNMEELTRNLKLEMDGGVIDNEPYDGKGRNLWGLFSGVTRWTTHSKKAPNRKFSDGRLEGIMSGTNYRFNQKALEYCLDSLNVKLKSENKELVEL